MPAAVPISDIVSLVSGTYAGPAELSIEGMAPLHEAGERHLTFLSNPKYAAQLGGTRAAAVLVGREVEGDDPRFIRVRNPYFAMSQVMSQWFAKRPMPLGISPLASIAKSARLGHNVAIGPFVTIADDVVIGDDVTIFQNVSIEAGASIGDNTLIYPNVTIYDRMQIGRRCILHAGVVVGSDGYGFAQDGGRHHKVPQMGIVRIEDDVELGAGTTVDRAVFGETVIGEGTKVDNLVQIGHNVKIGKHCLLVSQVGIAGSTELGDYVVVAGQSGFAGHLKIGSRVQVAAKSAVLKDVPADTKVMGSPAIGFGEFSRREVWLRRLPELARKLTHMERMLATKDKRR